MADEVEISLQSGGAKIAADEIAGLHHQRVKPQFGEDGTATDVSLTNPMPVQGAVFPGGTPGGRRPILLGARIDTTAPADGGDDEVQYLWLDPTGAVVVAGFDGTGPQPLSVAADGRVHGRVDGWLPEDSQASFAQPVTIAGRAFDGAPSDVDDGDVAYMWVGLSGAVVTGGYDGVGSQPFLCDSFGRQVVTRSPRELSGDNQIVIADTVNTVLVAAGGVGVFRDLTEIFLSNSSATASLATLRDGATTRWQGVVPAGGNVPLRFDPPLTQAAVATAWNLQMGTSVTSIHAFAKYLET